MNLSECYIDRTEHLERNSGLRCDEDMEEGPLLKDFIDGGRAVRKPGRKISTFLSKHWFPINLTLTTVNLVFLVSLIYWHHVQQQPTRCKEPLLPPSPAVDAIEKELRPFSLTSPYSESPGPEVDRMWHELVNTGAMFLLTPKEFAAVNDNPKTGVRYTHDPEGHYVGTLASTHQIHCVNSLRKALWFNYEHYKGINDFLFTGNDAPEEHIMHCVEMLRNAIMCSGDVSVITYNWKKGHESPKASFKSMHSCQKWDRIEAWRVKHNVTSYIKTLERPIGLLDEEKEDI